jgi:hypothetical protein
MLMGWSSVAVRYNQEGVQKAAKRPPRITRKKLRRRFVLTIRLSKSDWGKAWRAMIELAPVRLIADDPIYEVLPAHLELLNARGFSYEVVQSSPPRPPKRRHGTAN